MLIAATTIAAAATFVFWRAPNEVVTTPSAEQRGPEAEPEDAGERTEPSRQVHRPASQTRASGCVWQSPRDRVSATRWRSRRTTRWTLFKPGLGFRHLVRQLDVRQKAIQPHGHPPGARAKHAQDDRLQQ
jgi:hypothetical protein